MDERKNNILFLEQFGNHIGGGQIILLGILEYLQKTNQWNIFVSLPEEGVFTDLLRKKGFECIITPMVKHSMKSSFLIDISRYSFTSIRSAYTLSKLIQKHRIKIVYCNGGRTFMSSI
ncbi:MAG: hypothetical protein MJE63_33245, partial [Proteobacteria bacterium]|nr:hypothetical protein [Pseudomonadota bacterium]